MTSTTDPREATPRTATSILSVSPAPEVVVAAVRRGITEILHFTTVRGAVGIMYSKCVKARSLLREDQLLEHVYRPNAIDRRRDAAWHGYVNLSVTRINDWMFDVSHRWHITENVSWVVLSFSPAILGDPGVVFTTTNNAYDPYTRRAEGQVGFERMFDPSVLGYNGRPVSRGALPEHYPTHRQAEVLYPFELKLEHLQRMYVQTENGMDHLQGVCGALDVEVDARLAPEVFH